VSSPAETIDATTSAPEAGWAVRFVRTPLLTKLVFLDIVVNLVVLGLMQLTPPEHAQEVTIVSLVVVLVLNATLVAWALRPLQVLEDTARRVSQGEFTARTSMPPMADRNLVRIGATLDELLDRVARERQRVRTLAAQVVAAGDQERAHIARELHDGTAQSLTALEMLLSSMLSEHPDGPVHDKVQIMRDIATDALAEVRALSHAMHPRVLDDLGLGAALEQLARRVREQDGPEIVITSDCPADRAPSKALASVLYRVAQEALNNAVKHAQARRIEIRFECDGDRLRLTVADDGIGFDRASVEALRRGMGLFVMQERVSLVDGVLQILTAPGRGTEVRAALPVSEAA
jgi:signal transduction histidine kinase